MQTQFSQGMSHPTPATADFTLPRPDQLLTVLLRKLLGVLQTYIDDVRNPESRLHLLKALSCLRYVFKFIIKSRQLYIK